MWPLCVLYGAHWFTTKVTIIYLVSSAQHNTLLILKQAVCRSFQSCFSDWLVLFCGTVSLLKFSFYMQIQQKSRITLNRVRFKHKLPHITEELPIAQSSVYSNN